MTDVTIFNNNYIQYEMNYVTFIILNFDSTGQSWSEYFQIV